MQIDLFDNAACVYYEEQEIYDALIDKITDNTVETWQPDRKQNERKNNTAQGKAAEEIFKGVLKKFFPNTISRRGIVIGWIQREKLLDYSVDFKKMIQADKSERALYFAKNLRKVNGIESFPQIFVNDDVYAGQSIKSNDFVYASPFTRTNFYHKDKKCRYIRNVNENELIQYENEEAAKSEGRYVNRCRSCFEIRMTQPN